MKATFTSKSCGFEPLFDGRSYVVEITERGHVIRTDYKQYQRSGRKHVLSKAEAKVSPKRASAFFEELVGILHSKNRTQEEICDGDITKLELSHEPDLRQVEIASGLICDESGHTLCNVVGELLDELHIGKEIGQDINRIHHALASMLTQRLDAHHGQSVTAKQLYDLYGREVQGVLPENIDFEMLNLLIHDKAQSSGLKLEYLKGFPKVDLFEKPFAVS